MTRDARAKAIREHLAGLQQERERRAAHPGTGGSASSSKGPAALAILAQEEISGRGGPAGYSTHTTLRLHVCLPAAMAAAKASGRASGCESPHIVFFSLR